MRNSFVVFAIEIHANMKDHFPELAQLSKIVLDYTKFKLFPMNTEFCLRSSKTESMITAHIFYRIIEHGTFQGSESYDQTGQSKHKTWHLIPW